MRIERLDVLTFSVPFRTVFRHASASRRRARNLIVAARGPDGVIGWGESCPRPYVTGETVDGAAVFVVEHREAMSGGITDAASLRAWTDAHREVIDRNPAAFCAVEIAVLDLLGKVEGRATEDLLGIAPPAGDFRYSAVLGDSPWLVYRQQCRRYLADGFRDFKVKASGDPRRDRRKMRALADRDSTASDGLRVRIDANNLWQSVGTCVDHVNGLRHTRAPGRGGCPHAPGKSLISPRLILPVIVAGGLYFAVMAVRLVLGLSVLSHSGWFSTWIPTVFHLVLAGLMMLIAAYQRTRRWRWCAPPPPGSAHHRPAR
jgi:hypothetical protein